MNNNDIPDRRAFLGSLLVALAMPRARLLDWAAGPGGARLRRPPPRFLGVTGGTGGDADAIALLKSLGLTHVRHTLYWNNYLDTRTFARNSSVIDPKGRSVADWFAADLDAFKAAGIEVL